MTLEEMAMAAVNAINQKNVPGLEKSKPSVTLVMPPTKKEPKHRYLAGPHSPKGQVIARQVEGEIVVFDAVDLLAWCVARSNGKIKVTDMEGKDA